MSYRCCSLIQSCALNFNGRIDTEEPCISLCCENLPNIPKIPLSETAEDTLRSFMSEGLLAAVECAQVTADDQRHFTIGCVNCTHFCLMEIMKVLEVKHLTLSQDSRNKYHLSKEERVKRIGAAAYLLAICHKNGITNGMFAYSKEDKAETIQLATEILQKGLI